MIAAIARRPSPFPRRRARAAAAARGGRAARARAAAGARRAPAPEEPAVRPAPRVVPPPVARPAPRAPVPEPSPFRRRSSRRASRTRTRSRRRSASGCSNPGGRREDRREQADAGSARDLLGDPGLHRQGEGGVSGQGHAAGAGARGQGIEARRRSGAVGEALFEPAPNSRQARRDWPRPTSIGPAALRPAQRRAGRVGAGRLMRAPTVGTSGGCSRAAPSRDPAGTTAR